MKDNPTEGFYKNGQLQYRRTGNIYESFYENGQLKRKETWVIDRTSGTPEGTFFDYNESGFPIRRGTWCFYRNSYLELSGDLDLYDHLVLTEDECKELNDLLVLGCGVMYEYDGTEEEPGNHSYTSYDKNEPNGYCVVKNYNEELILSGEFKDGKRHGFFSYFKESDYSELWDYVDPDRYEKNEDGSLIRELEKTVEFRKGLKNGVETEYYPRNGPIKSKKTFLNNLPNGTWKYFDEDGNLTKTEDYKDGELL